MPYKIVNMDGGFMVHDLKGRMFSNKPLIKNMAVKQRVAIALSEAQKTGKSPSIYFAG